MPGPHPHHWLINTLPPYVGTCKHCGATREFPTPARYVDTHRGDRSWTKEVAARVREEKFQLSLVQAAAESIVREVR